MLWRTADTRAETLFKVFSQRDRNIHTSWSLRAKGNGEDVKVRTRVNRREQRVRKQARAEVEKFHRGCDDVGGRQRVGRFTGEENAEGTGS